MRKNILYVLKIACIKILKKFSTFAIIDYTFNCDNLSFRFTKVRVVKTVTQWLVLSNCKKIRLKLQTTKRKPQIIISVLYHAIFICDYTCSVTFLLIFPLFLCYLEYVYLYYIIIQQTV